MSNATLETSLPTDGSDIGARPVLILSYEGGGAFCRTHDPQQISFVAYDDGSTLTLDGCETFSRSTAGSLDAEWLREQVTAYLASDDSKVVMDDFEDVGVGIADIPTDVLTYVAPDGVHSVVKAFALGYEPRELLSARELRARNALQALVSQIRSATHSPRPWNPDGVTLSGLSTAETPQDAAEPWPLDPELLSTLASGSTPVCRVITGDDARTLISHQSGRPARSGWQTPGALYTVTVEPVVPGLGRC